MKYAVVESGGKQYIARPGEMIEVDRMPLDVGKPVKFSDILLVVDGSSVRIGQPTIKGAVVEGKVEGQIKGRKIIVFKYKPRIRYRRKQGHRQRYTQVSIKKITLPAEKAKAAPAAAGVKSEEAAKPAPRKAAPKKAAPAKKKPTAKAADKKPSEAAKPAAKKTAPKSTATKKPADKAKKPTTKKASSKPAAKKSTTSKKPDEK